MKKMGSIAMTALLAGSMMGGYSAMAQEGTAQVIEEQEEDATNYTSNTGVIKEMETEGKEIRITVENEQGMITIFRIFDDSLIFESGTAKQLKKSDLKKGEWVEGFYDKNKPMILIYPPTIIPDLLIVKNPEVFGEVKVGKFDKDGLSLDRKLKVNLGDRTELVNEKGKVISKEELHHPNTEWAVFYDATTRSIPPQAVPKKIMTLQYEPEEMPDEGQTNRVEEIIAADHYLKNGVKMIPLRKVAEELGYYVQSLPGENGALVTKQNQSFKIIRGEKMYHFNKNLAEFRQAPDLKGMKTYVSEDFLKQLQ